MGEMAVSNRAGDELVAIGLGSCIALAVIDREACVAGLAHVVLPDSQGKPGPHAKFADLAIPALSAKMTAAGAVQSRLEAVMIGGARMFSVGESMDIGARNAEAVRAALKQSGIELRAEETGGSRGRTARITVGLEVSSQLAGGARTSLLSFAEGATHTRSKRRARVASR